MNSEQKKPNFPNSARDLQLVFSIVPHSDFVLPNGNEKRHPETAMRSGNEKRQKDGSEEQGA
ncbi:MAG: hypothetical protein WB930_03585 [Syntrophobacteraceae bacterium]